MPRYFTVYWTNARWDQKRDEADGQVFGHISGNDFRQKGMSLGDFVYVVTVIQGQLFLAGRIQVDQIVDQEEAERLYRRPLYEAEDHVLARNKNEVPFDFGKIVPVDVTERLMFLRKGKRPASLVFNEGGGLDQQTLRITRELTPESAEMLNSIIGLSTARDG